MSAKAVYVLDAQALVVLARDDAGAERIAQVLGEACAGHCRVLLHQISYGEAIYMIGREFGWPVAQSKRAEILMLPIEIVSFTEDMFWDAVWFDATQATPASGFAAILARNFKATLLTGDPVLDAAS